MKHLLSLFIILLAVPVFAQYGKLQGSVADAKTGELLTGVTLCLEDTDERVMTDFDGKFAFQHIPEGTTTLTVKFVSYEQKVYKRITVDKNEVTEMNIKLFPAEPVQNTPAFVAQEFPLIGENDKS